MFIFVYQRKIQIRGLIVTIQQIKREIQELKAAVEVKKALPWDCKNFIRRYQAEISRREILCKFYDFTGVAYESQGPYRLVVENQRGFSRESREFLSLSAEKQAEAVEYSIRLADMINRIVGLEEVEHRLTRGCQFFGIEPLNICLNPENSSV